MNLSSYFSRLKFIEKKKIQMAVEFLLNLL